MKLLVVLLVAAVAAAAPAPGGQNEIQLVKSIYDNSGLGNYNFEYVQDNGQAHEEAGELKNAGTDDEALSVRGQYSWVGPDGVTYTVTYLADENGFQPTIEQGPGGGVPPAVIASLLG